MKVKLQEHSARISQSSEVFRHSRKVRLEDAEETARFTARRVEWYICLRGGTAGTLGPLDREQSNSLASFTLS